MFLALNVSVVGLERALAAYLKEAAETPFDMKTVPLATAPIHEQKPVKTGKCRIWQPGSCFPLILVTAVKV